jgi:hypothetical protein
MLVEIPEEIDELLDLDKHMRAPKTTLDLVFKNYQW